MLKPRRYSLDNYVVDLENEDSVVTADQQAAKGIALTETAKEAGVVVAEEHDRTTP